MQPLRAPEPEPRPPSPCTKVCALDERGYCLGCRRTAAEIGRWTTMSAAEQWQLVAELPTRGGQEPGFLAAGQAAPAATFCNERVHSEVNAMDVVDRIKSEIGSNPVVLFMKGTPDFPQCGFSAQTVAALRACGAEFRAFNIFEDPELRDALKRYSNWPTYPQLYVKGELVGGCDIALEMYQSGELKKLLTEVGAAK